jgi:iron complex transport system substrate-binding protein
MSITLNRRSFTLGTAGLALGAMLPRGAFAQETRSVTTKFGTYDIPASPQRVVAVDSRLDLQPALALGLPVIGHGHSLPARWVPGTQGLEYFGAEINIEQVLAANPDLIICADYEKDADSSWWPARRLREIAPVVPTSAQLPWKDALRELAHVLGRDGQADAAMAEYDALITDIRSRRAEQIATKTVVTLQPNATDVFLSTGTTMLPTQVLADLGAKTIPPGADQPYMTDAIPAEGLGDTLGNVDGLLLVTGTDADVAGVAEMTTWQRLPAVRAGATINSNGNINYGSIYSAIQIAKFMDELYGKMA